MLNRPLLKVLPQKNPKGLPDRLVAPLVFFRRMGVPVSAQCSLRSFSAPALSKAVPCTRHSELVSESIT